MQRTDKDVDDYLVWISGESGEDMRTLDRAISERMSGRERLLYEGTFWGGSDQETSATAGWTIRTGQAPR